MKRELAERYQSPLLPTRRRQWVGQRHALELRRLSWVGCRARQCKQAARLVAREALAEFVGMPQLGSAVVFVQTAHAAGSIGGLVPEVVVSQSCQAHEPFARFDLVFFAGRPLPL